MTQLVRASFERVHPKAKMPVQATKKSAGFDVYAVGHKRIPARGRALIDTGLRLSQHLPDTVYIRVAPRSGLAVKYGLDTGAGVVDCDFTGSIGVVLFNHSDEGYDVQEGDRIAQLIFTTISVPVITEEKQSTTEQRNGFGSTGRGLTLT